MLLSHTFYRLFIAFIAFPALISLSLLSFSLLIIII